MISNQSVSTANDLRSNTDSAPVTMSNSDKKLIALRIPEPLKANESVKTVNPFPIQSFPEPLQMLIAQSKDCLGFPMDYTGTSILYAASVLIGTTHKVKVFEGFVTGVTSFFVLMGNKGVTKTHPLTLALKPIQDIDKRLYNQYKIDKKEFDRYIGLSDAMQKDYGEAPEAPILRKTLVTDFTIETLQKVHADNLRGMGVYVDELIALIKGFDRYGKGSIGEQQLMSIFSGIPIDVIRGGGNHVRINSPFVSVIGTMQPDILQDFAKGRDKNGFLDRFLFAYPVGAKKIKWSDLKGEINKECLDEYDRICNAIHQIPLERERNEDGFGDVISKIVPFAPAAKQVLFDWQGTITDDINDGEGGECGKLDSIIPRIALILQILHDTCEGKTTNQIEAETVKKAIDLMCYFRNCAKQVYAEVTGANPTHGIEGEIYAKLPNTFEWKDAVKLAKEMNMSDRTMARHVNDDSKYTKIRKGFYEKINPKILTIK